MTIAARCAWACVLALCVPVCAAPYLPARGDEVVERLPRRADPVQRELAGLRAQLSARPRDLPLAIALARRYVEVARSESDPRYLGYAQAALAPWWQLPAPPPPVRLLRATLMQSTHRFAEALADLDAVVAADPGNLEAWLTRATIQTVRGDYAGATASCAHVAATGMGLAAITCIANVGAMTGRARASAELLAATLRRSGDDSAALRAWALTLLAEIAARRGDPPTAEAHFRQALALAPRDSYLLGAYADFLLDRQRPDEVARLLRDHTRIDGLLLRHALALRRLPRSADALRAAVAELGARFDAAVQRGDSVHQREHARYELLLRGDAQAALLLARRNWEVQKEPADMRILLEAALATGDREAAAPVLGWIRKHALEDVVLDRLARQLRGEA